MELNDLANRFVPGCTVNVEERSSLEIQMALSQTAEKLSGLVIKYRKEDDRFSLFTLLCLVVVLSRYIYSNLLFLLLLFSLFLYISESSFGVE